MLHDLSRQLRRLMKEAARSSFGQRPSSRSLAERNVIRLKSVTGAGPFRTPFGWRNRLLMERGARMHATSVERGDSCAIAILDHRGVVHTWHDSLPGATAFDFRIIGAHVSQFYLPQDVALLRHWDEQPHVIESGVDEDWGWETELARDPPWREQLVAELDGRPIGFIQIIDPALEDSHYWGEDVPPNLRAIDIWIGEASELGKGHGTRMMELAIERCFADPAVTEILIDPLARNTRAHRF